MAYSPKDQDILWPQGVDFGVVWPMYDGDNPADLFGYSGLCHVRASEDRNSLLYVALPVSIVDGYKVMVQIDRETSVLWAWDFGYYDVILIAPDGSSRPPIAQGTIIVDPIVTAVNL